MDPRQLFYIQWLTEQSSNVEVSRFVYLVPSLLMLSVLSSLIFYLFLPRRSYLFSIINIFLLIGVVSGFQACGQQASHSVAQKTPIDRDLPPGADDLGNFFNGDGEGPADVADNIKLFARGYADQSPLYFAGNKAHYPECSSLLHSYGVTLADGTAGQTACRFVNEWDDYEEEGANGGTCAWKGARAILERCTQPNAYLQLSHGTSVSGVNPKTFVAEHAAPFFVGAYCVVEPQSIASLSNAGACPSSTPSNIRPGVYIINPDLLKYEVRSSSSYGIVEKMPNSGWFSPTFTDYEDGRISSKAVEIHLAENQGEGSAGQIVLENPPSVRVIVAPESRLPWEGAYNIGLDLTDHVQESLRNSSRHSYLSTSNGELVLEDVDHLLPLPSSNLSLSVVRTYRSLQDTYGMFGRNWSLSLSRERYFVKLQSPTGEVGEPYAIYTSGEGRYFSPEGSPFWLDSDPLKPDFDKTFLFKTFFWIGSNRYYYDAFDLNGQMTYQADSVTTNGLYYFYEGNRLKAIFDQDAMRESPANIQAILNTYRAAELLLAGTSANESAALSTIQTNIRPKNGRSLWFVTNNKGLVKYILDNTGKALRYTYGTHSSTDPVEDFNCLSQSSQNCGDLLKRVDSIVYEPVYYSGSGITAGANFAATTRSTQFTNLYAYEYVNPNDSSVNEHHGRMRSAWAFHNPNRLTAVSYRPAADSDLYGAMPLVSSFSGDEVSYEVSYEFRNGDEGTQWNHCGGSVSCNELNKVHAITQLTDSLGRTYRYKTDRRGMLLLKEGPTPQTTSKVLDAHVIDEKLLRITSSWSVGSHTLRQYNHNGIVEKIIECSLSSPSNHSVVFSSTCAGTQKETDLHTLRIRLYNEDLSGTFSILEYTQPSYSAGGVTRRQTFLSPERGSSDFAGGHVSGAGFHDQELNWSCEGGPGITTQKIDGGRFRSSGSRCITMPDIAKGGAFVAVESYHSSEKGTPMGMGSVSAVRNTDTESAPWNLSTLAPLFTNAFSPRAAALEKYGQAGFINIFPASGYKRIYENGWRLLSAPVQRHYRDSYGNSLFYQHPLGGVVRNIYTYRFPAATLVASFKTFPKLVNTPSNPHTNILSNTWSNVESEHPEDVLKERARLLLGISSEASGNPMNPYRLELVQAFRPSAVLGRPEWEFIAGKGVREYVYDASRGLLKTVRNYYLEGYVPGSGDPTLSTTARNFTESYTYCFESGSGCSFSSEDLAVTQSPGSKTTQSYLASGDRRQYQVKSESGSGSSLRRTEERVEVFDDYGRQQRVRKTWHGDTLNRPAETTEYSYSSAWGKVEEVRSSRASSSHEAYTIYEYEDEFSSILHSVTKKDFLDDEETKIVSTDFDVFGKARTVQVKDNSDRTVSEEAMTCSSGCDRDLYIATRSSRLKIMGDFSSGFDNIFRITYGNSFGGTRATCESAAPIATCTGAKSIVHIYSDYGLKYQTRAYEKTGSSAYWHVEHQTDPFGQIIYDQESPHVNFSGEFHVSARGALKLNRMSWAGLNFNDDSAVYSQPFDLRNSFTSQFKLQLGKIRQQLGLPFAWRILDWGESRHSALGPIVWSRMGRDADGAWAFGKFSLNTTSGALTLDMTDKNSGRKTREVSHVSHKDQYSYFSDFGGPYNLTTVNENWGLSAPISETRNYRYPWQSSGGSLQSQTDISIDDFGRPVSAEVREASSLQSAIANSYSDGKLAFSSNTFTPEDSPSILSFTAYDYHDGIFSRVPRSMTISSCAGTISSGNPNCSGSQELANQKGEADLLNTLSGAGEPLETSYLPNLSSPLNPIDLPLLEARIHLDRNAFGDILNIEKSLDVRIVDASQAELVVSRPSGDLVYSRIPASNKDLSVQITHHPSLTPTSRLRSVEMRVDADIGGPTFRFDINTGNIASRSEEIARIRTTRPGSSTEAVPYDLIAFLSDPSLSPYGLTGVDEWASQFSSGWFGFWPWVHEGVRLDLTPYPRRSQSDIPARYEFDWEGSQPNVYVSKISALPAYATGSNPFLRTGLSSQNIPRRDDQLQGDQNYSCELQQWKIVRPVDGGAYDPYTHLRLYHHQAFSGQFNYNHHEQIRPGTSPNISYDERGNVRSLTQDFEHRTSAAQWRKWKRVKNYAYDEVGNVSLVEDLTYYQSAGFGETNYQGEMKLIRATTYLNHWVPAPDATAFKTSSYVLVKQQISDTGPVTVGSYEISKRHSPEMTGSYGGTLNDLTIFYVPGPDGSPVYAYYGFPNEEGGLSSLTGLRIEYDQSGNLTAITRDQASSVVAGFDKPAREYAYYSPFGLKTIHRVNDPNHELKIMTSGGQPVEYFDQSMTELYMAMDPRYPVWPSFGKAGKYFDGVLTDGNYDSFSGRHIHNGSGARLRDMCTSNDMTREAVRQVHLMRDMQEDEIDYELHIPGSELARRKLIEGSMKNGRPTSALNIGRIPFIWDVVSRSSMKELNEDWYLRDDTSVRVSSFLLEMTPAYTGAMMIENAQEGNTRGALINGAWTAASVVGAGLAGAGIKATTRAARAARLSRIAAASTLPVSPYDVADLGKGAARLLGRGSDSFAGVVAKRFSASPDVSSAGSGGGNLESIYSQLGFTKNFAGKWQMSTDNAVFVLKQDPKSGGGALKTFRDSSGRTRTMGGKTYYEVKFNPDAHDVEGIIRHEVFGHGIGFQQTPMGRYYSRVETIAQNHALAGNSERALEITRDNPKWIAVKLLDEARAQAVYTDVAREMEITRFHLAKINYGTVYEQRMALESLQKILFKRGYEWVGDPQSKFGREVRSAAMDWINR